LTSGKNLFSAHIHVKEGVDTERVLANATAILDDKFGFYFSTVQVEHSCTQHDKAEAIDFASASGGHSHGNSPT